MLALCYNLIVSQGYSFAVLSWYCMVAAQRVVSKAAIILFTATDERNIVNAISLDY